MNSVSMGVCPSCSSQIDELCHISGKGKPKENDIAVCGNCESLVIFQNSGKWFAISASYLKDMQRYEPMDYTMLINAKAHTLRKLVPQKAVDIIDKVKGETDGVK
jgi:hypothetical protein